MNKEQENKIFTILKEMKDLEDECQRKLLEKRKELIRCSLYFKNYRELYGFVKAHTPNLDAFIKDIQEARKLRKEMGFDS